MGTIRNLRLTTIHTHHDHLAKQIRRMLIPQLFVLGISGIPFGFQTIYLGATSTVNKSDVRLSIENLFVQIIRLFYHCNFVCTFYIYVYMSSEVRKVLRRLMMKYLRRNVIQPGDTSVGAPITLRSIKP